MFGPIFEPFSLPESGDICNNTVTKDHITPQTCRYLVKCQCLKETIEHTTSVTTHFKKLITGNFVCVVSGIV